MTNIEGCRANPIDWEMYESMIATQTWTGGWVKKKGDPGPCYITASGYVQRNGKNNLGSEFNPFVEAAYNEMTEKGYWEGGYVRYSDSCPAFYRPCGDGYGEKYASGCGSGCSTGCGENATIEMGAKQVTVGPYQFTLAWDSGIANTGDGSAELSVLNLTGGYLQMEYMEVRWTAPYVVFVYIRDEGGVEYSVYVNVP